MPDQIPPLPRQRALPEPDRMLETILADEPRPRRWLPMVAATTLAVALAAGATAWWYDSREPDPSAGYLGSPSPATPTASPARPTTSSAGTNGTGSTGTGRSSTGAPTSAAASPSRWVDANGTAHFVDAGTATFTHFSVTVEPGAPTPVAGQWARRVRVCVRELGPAPVDGRTRISWDPWTLEQDGVRAQKVVDDSRQRPSYPLEKWFAPQECATGVITFTGEATQDATLTYRNADYGETAVWQISGKK